MTTDDSDTHIADRATELSAVWRRLLQDAKPPAPGLRPSIEFSQFEAFANDVD